MPHTTLVLDREDTTTDRPELRYPIQDGCDGITECPLDEPCDHPPVLGAEPEDFTDLDAKYRCPFENDHELEHLFAYIQARRAEGGYPDKQ